jgi:hypothetical protein
MSNSPAKMTAANVENSSVTEHTPNQHRPTTIHVMYQIWASDLRYPWISLNVRVEGEALTRLNSATELRGLVPRRRAVSSRWATRPALRVGRFVTACKYLRYMAFISCLNPWGAYRHLTETHRLIAARVFTPAVTDGSPPRSFCRKGVCPTAKSFSIK